jgi:CelD/BcsL family acetyltransferase involved in cellulose biosynthesis
VRRIELMATGENEEDEIASDYVGALVERGCERDVAHAAARAIDGGECGDWDELLMPSMDAEDPFVLPLAQALREAGMTVSTAAGAQCPVVPLPANWDAYLRELGTEKRYAVNRALRELERFAGTAGFRLCCARSEAELTDGLGILRDLHAERWAASGRKGVFESNRFARFHEEVMPRMLAGEDGSELELLWLCAADRPIAAAYNVVFDGKVHFYQSGRAVDLPKNVRPGIAIHALAIRRSIELGRREYDFLAGASRYKRDLALATRHTVSLRAVARGLRPRAIESARALAERAIAQVRSLGPDASSRTKHAAGSEIQNEDTRG